MGRERWTSKGVGVPKVVLGVFTLHGIQDFSAARLDRDVDELIDVGSLQIACNLRYVLLAVSALHL